VRDSRTGLVGKGGERYGSVPSASEFLVEKRLVPTGSGDKGVEGEEKETVKVLQEKAPSKSWSILRSEGDI